MFKKKNSIDNEGLNEIIYLGKSILKVLYFALIIAIIFASIGIGRMLGLFSFLGTLFKILSPLFIGFIIAWLFHPIVTKMTKKERLQMLQKIEEEMREAAKELDFERAMELRDILFEMKAED